MGLAFLELKDNVFHSVTSKKLEQKVNRYSSLDVTCRHAIASKIFQFYFKFYRQIFHVIIFHFNHQLLTASCKPFDVIKH